MLNSFACPAAAVLEDREATADLITSATSGLLGLIGVTADPISSREHILISNIIQHSWKQGQDVDIASLIRSIQTPPFERVGAFVTDSFFPAKERYELALKLNNLLAAPGFGAWLEGEPLDVARFLHTPEGRPRISIFSIAHLSDAERMFFVTLLLNQVVAWMRTQPGTTSLRALVYMDEVAGYLPPVADPPSKKPLMLLFKQARAFGVGVLLATQNPVDLDYKALSNAGTWFVGRLQTPQDIDRLVKGMGGGEGESEEDLRKTISALGKRVFLMKNIHENAPEVFQTRWCLSYLRGPLTLAQIKTLTAGRKTAPPAVAEPSAEVMPAAPAAGAATAGRPSLPPQIPEFFLPLRGAKPAGARAAVQARGLCSGRRALCRRTKPAPGLHGGCRQRDGCLELGPGAIRAISTKRSWRKSPKPRLNSHRWHPRRRNRKTTKSGPAISRIFSIAQPRSIRIAARNSNSLRIRENPRAIFASASVSLRAKNATGQWTH